jgi:hypothetical protein
MGLAAISYGALTLVAATIAYRGPTSAAKVVASFVLASWVLCNWAFNMLNEEWATIAFASVDYVGSSLGILLMLMRPQRWRLLFTACVVLQSIMHTAFYGQAHHYWYIVTLNGLLIPQLIAITIPFWTEVRCRKFALV